MVNQQEDGTFAIKKELEQIINPHSPKDGGGLRKKNKSDHMPTNAKTELTDSP